MKGTVWISLSSWGLRSKVVSFLRDSSHLQPPRVCWRQSHVRCKMPLFADVDLWAVVLIWITPSARRNVALRREPCQLCSHKRFGGKLETLCGLAENRDKAVDRGVLRPLVVGSSGIAPTPSRFCGRAIARRSGDRRGRHGYEPHRPHTDAVIVWAGQ
jgi:hypothetical protein